MYNYGVSYATACKLQWALYTTICAEIVYCSKYRGISLLPNTYKILSIFLQSKLTLYAEEITGENQRGFRRNRSTTDHILCIRCILEKKWEYNEAVHQLFVDFKKAYDSVSKEVLYVYNILIEFVIPVKLIRLIKMCLNETSHSPGRQVFV